MSTWRTIASTVMFGFLVSATPAGADVVVDWNLITAQTAPATRFQGVLIDYAMVHLAMHDAIQAIEQRYEPYGLPNSGCDWLTDCRCRYRSARCAGQSVSRLSGQPGHHPQYLSQ